jgi:hypothetical protein
MEGEGICLSLSEEVSQHQVQELLSEPHRSRCLVTVSHNFFQKTRRSDLKLALPYSRIRELFSLFDWFISKLYSCVCDRSYLRSLVHECTYTTFFLNLCIHALYQFMHSLFLDNPPSPQLCMAVNFALSMSSPE